ncbi:PE-PPE domain-containing protein [Gordonia sp. MP11Mi]|uniref:PE-PPE domain-containing protein n=1 Tax=Gordonia sp. MP11Mi TaxID=3022769 RepID=A0AA97GUL7_9ACTN
MVAGTAGPAWADGPTDARLDQYADAGSNPADFDDVLGKWVAADRLEGALVVVTPGTDDTGLAERTAGLVGARENWIVKYPESIWPVSSGKSGSLLPFFAPTYDQSKGVAIDANLSIMRALAGAGGMVVYTGYSQGADALGNAAELANAEHLLDENTVILLVSDPRGPWGLKPGLEKIPFVPLVMAFIGANNDGARDPGATGDARVVQVIINGDPVANWQWNPLRPVSSLLVDLAGFVTIHAGTGPYSYANLDELELKKTLYSAEGNTTYEVYDTYHPLALVNWMIADALGIDVDEAQLREWDRQAEIFYPLQEVTPETADPGVKVVEQRAGRHRLVDENGDHVQAVKTATSGAGTYVPRHAAPEVDPAPTEPAATERGATELGASEPESSEPVATGSEATGSDTAEPEAAEEQSDEQQSDETATVPADDAPDPDATGPDSA